VQAITRETYELHHFVFSHYLHKYFGINWRIVWDVLQHKIPAFSQQLRRVLEAEFDVDS